MRIYVAGPYTKGDVAVNVRNAILAGNNLRALGHAPYIPHLTHFWHMLIPHDIDYWYKVDLEWLDACDGLLRLPGESAGADNEVKYAHGIGIPVFYSIDEIYKHDRQQ